VACSLKSGAQPQSNLVAITACCASVDEVQAVSRISCRLVSGEGGGAERGHATGSILLADI
jgi:hypothetical protein